MSNASKRPINDVSFDSEEGGKESLEDLMPAAKKIKKSLNVRFDAVNVFYFDRQQGYQAIPSAGTNTLGMSFKHTHHEKYNLEDYLSHKRLLHLNIVENDKQVKKFLMNNLKSKNDTQVLDTEDSNNDFDDYDLTSDVTLLDINKDLPINMELFCPLLTPADRTRIIKLNSIEGIDNSESRDIASVRKSREKCGCACKDVCDENFCSCILNGIGCQLDKARFPCACSMKKCKNPFGIKRFDVKSVRDHYNEVLYPHLCKSEVTQEHGTEKRSSKRKGRKRKGTSSRNVDNKRKRSISPVKTVIDGNGSNCSSDDNELLLSIDAKSKNMCLDLMPYEPFDLFKTGTKIQEITI